jgi:hypothetical protein
MVLQIIKLFLAPIVLVIEALTLIIVALFAAMFFSIAMIVIFMFDVFDYFRALAMRIKDDEKAED